MSTIDSSFDDGVFQLVMRSPGVFNPDSLAAFNAADAGRSAAAAGSR